ncbi:Hypothetical protein HVR_LOCUS1049 [uncultured virus]|nr:Hypothetical protein HVR_LOCUS1049 [uncultured virus]
MSELETEKYIIKGVSPPKVLVDILEKEKCHLDKLRSHKEEIIEKGTTKGIPDLNEPLIEPSIESALYENIICVDWRPLFPIGISPRMLGYEEISTEDHSSHESFDLFDKLKQYQALTELLVGVTLSKLSDRIANEDPNRKNLDGDGWINSHLFPSVGVSLNFYYGLQEKLLACDYLDDPVSFYINNFRQLIGYMGDHDEVRNYVIDDGPIAKLVFLSGKIKSSEECYLTYIRSSGEVILVKIDIQVLRNQLSKNPIISCEVNNLGVIDGAFQLHDHGNRMLGNYYWLTRGKKLLLSNDVSHLEPKINRPCNVIATGITHLDNFPIQVKDSGKSGVTAYHVNESGLITSPRECEHIKLITNETFCYIDHARRGYYCVGVTRTVIPIDNIKCIVPDEYDTKLSVIKRSFKQYLFILTEVGDLYRWRSDKPEKIKIIASNVLKITPKYYLT